MSECVHGSVSVCVVGGLCVFQRKREGESARTFSSIYLCCGQNDNLERDLSAAHFIMLNINTMRPGKLFHPDRARLHPKSQLVAEIQPENIKAEEIHLLFSGVYSSYCKIMAQ